MVVQDFVSLCNAFGTLYPLEYPISAITEEGFDRLNRWERMFTGTADAYTYVDNNGARTFISVGHRNSLLYRIYSQVNNPPTHIELFVRGCLNLCYPAVVGYISNEINTGVEPSVVNHINRIDKYGWFYPVYHNYGSFPKMEFHEDLTRVRKRLMDMGVYPPNLTDEFVKLTLGEIPSDGYQDIHDYIQGLSEYTVLCRHIKDTAENSLPEGSAITNINVMRFIGLLPGFDQISGYINADYANIPFPVQSFLAEYNNAYAIVPPVNEPDIPEHLRVMDLEIRLKRIEDMLEHVLDMLEKPEEYSEHERKVVTVLRKFIKPYIGKRNTPENRERIRRIVVDSLSGLTDNLENPDQS